jgi:hypothetical protein
MNLGGMAAAFRNHVFSQITRTPHRKDGLYFQAKTWLQTAAAMPPAENPRHPSETLRHT